MSVVNYKTVESKSALEIMNDINIKEGDEIIIKVPFGSLREIKGTISMIKFNEESNKILMDVKTQETSYSLELKFILDRGGSIDIL